MKHIEPFESFAMGAFTTLLLFAAIAAVAGVLEGVLRPLIGLLMTGAILTTALLLVSSWVWFTNNPVQNNKE